MEVAAENRLRQSGARFARDLFSGLTPWALAPVARTRDLRYLAPLRKYRSRLCHLLLGLCWQPWNRFGGPDARWVFGAEFIGDFAENGVIVCRFVVGDGVPVHRTWSGV
jgi:hypothetical protein